jgi:hypothetical protein
MHCNALSGGFTERLTKLKLLGPLQGPSNALAMPQKWPEILLAHVWEKLGTGFPRFDYSNKIVHNSTNNELSSWKKLSKTSPITNFDLSCWKKNRQTENYIKNRCHMKRRSNSMQQKKKSRRKALYKVGQLINKHAVLFFRISWCLVFRQFFICNVLWFLLSF